MTEREKVEREKVERDFEFQRRQMWNAEFHCNPPGHGAEIVAAIIMLATLVLTVRMVLLLFGV